MGRHRHTGLVVHSGGAEHVHEAPGADHPSFFVRQQPQHLVARADHGMDGVVDLSLTPACCGVVRAVRVEVSDDVAHGSRLRPRSRNGRGQGRSAHLDADGALARGGEALLSAVIFPSARFLTPCSICWAMTKSAGMIRAQYDAASHHGPRLTRERKMNRVRPAPTSRSVNAHVQSIQVSNRSANCGGRCSLECRTRCRFGSRMSTVNPHPVSGAPSGTQSPTERCCSSGTMRLVLGGFAGNRRRSTQRAVYHWPRCQPSCTSHGQMSSGGVSMVMAWVVTIIGCWMSSSPGK